MTHDLKMDLMFLDCQENLRALGVSFLLASVPKWNVGLEYEAIQQAFHFAD